MTNILIHKDISPSEVHAPYSYKFSTTLERTSIQGLTSGDLGKLALQLDDYSVWVLTSTAPTWKKLLLQGDSALPSGIAGGDLEGLFPSPSVIHDSHLHTPGVSIPLYPSTLPPSGPSGGDLVGLYPNPQLAPSGVVAGLYNNPSLRVDAKGRVIQASSNPLGEANTGTNLGAGATIYAGKNNTALQFKSLKTSTNSGLTIEQSSTEVTLLTPGLAKLTGATFTGGVTLPKLSASEVVATGPIYSSTFDAGSGSIWAPDARDGNQQIRTLTSDGVLSRIVFAQPGMTFTFYLKQPSGNNPAVIAFTDEYKFAVGADKRLSTSPLAVDVLQVEVMSSAFYFCKLHKGVK